MDIDVSDSFWKREFARVNTVVVGNGEIPDSEESRFLLNSCSRIICCDGAFNKLTSIGIKPDLIVGDGDSADLSEAVRLKIPFCQDKCQEYNDLQKALLLCIDNEYDNVVLIGCAGLREDHFIANLSIMTMYSEKFGNLSMLTEHGIFNIYHNTAKINSVKGMQISVFVKDENTHLTFKGLKYTVNDRAFRWFWEGSLNEAVGDEFSIESDTDEPFVIYRAKLF